MAYCTNCGKQFEGKFCPDCGTPEGSSYVNENAAQKPDGEKVPKRNGSFLKFYSFIATVAMIVAIFVAISYSSKINSMEGSANQQSNATSGVSYADFSSEQNNVWIDMYEQAQEMYKEERENNDKLIEQLTEANFSFDLEKVNYILNLVDESILDVYGGTCTLEWNGFSGMNFTISVLSEEAIAMADDIKSGNVAQTEKWKSMVADLQGLSTSIREEIVSEDRPRVYVTIYFLNGTDNEHSLFEDFLVFGVENGEVLYDVTGITKE